MKVSRLLSEPEVAVHWVGFRKCAGLLKSREEAITALATQKLENELYLRHLFHIADRHSIPQVPVASMDDAEKAAEYVRSLWNIGADPITGVVETLEDHGVVVLAWEESSGFDGVAGWANENFAVIAVNSTVSSDRTRFNAAHELGHLVMKCPNGVDEEPLAHRFAASFLVPAGAARAELGEHRWTLSLPELGLLKERWGFSMQAWIRRAWDLQIIDANQYKLLNIDIRRRGWHKVEPVRYEGIEEPIMLRRLVSRALSEAVVSRSDASDLYPEYELTREARLESKRFTMRDLAKLDIEQRHRILSESFLEVDPSETEDWDEVEIEEPDPI